MGDTLKDGTDMSYCGPYVSVHYNKGIYRASNVHDADKGELSICNFCHEKFSSLTKVKKP